MAKICTDCKHCIKPEGWTKEKELTSENKDDLAKCALSVSKPEQRVVHLVCGETDTIPAEFNTCADNRYNGECGIVGHYHSSGTLTPAAEPVVSGAETVIYQGPHPQNPPDHK